MIEEILLIGERVYDKKKLSSEEQKLLINSYFKETGIRKRPGCGNCYIEIYQYFNKLKTKKMENQFLLKDNTRLFIGSQVIMRRGKVNHCTDEKALQYLNHNPKNIHFFEKYPSNWQELAAEYDPLKVMRAKKDEVPVVHTSGEIDYKKVKEDALSEKSVVDLKAYLLELNKNDADKYPKKDWNLLNKAALIKYILDKD